MGTCLRVLEGNSKPVVRLFATGDGAQVRCGMGKAVMLWDMEDLKAAPRSAFTVDAGPRECAEEDGPQSDPQVQLAVAWHRRSPAPCRGVLFKQCSETCGPSSPSQWDILPCLFMVWGG